MNKWTSEMRVEIFMVVRGGEWGRGTFFLLLLSIFVVFFVINKNIYSNFSKIIFQQTGWERYMEAG